MQTLLPLDMRKKKTRAIRKALTKEQVRPPACVRACLAHVWADEVVLLSASAGAQIRFPFLLRQRLCFGNEGW